METTKEAIEKNFPAKITLFQDKPQGNLSIDSSTTIMQTVSIYLDGMGRLLRVAEIGESFEFSDENLHEMFDSVICDLKEARIEDIS